MKQLKVVFFIIYSAVVTNAQTSISGIWNTGTDNTKVELKEVLGLYEGVTVSSDNDQVQNGIKIVKDVEAEEGVWKGLIYVARKQEWAKARFVRKGDKLDVTVYFGWMSKTVSWIKVE